MSRNLNFKISLVASVVLAMSLAQAMTKAEYTAANGRISADYKADKAACASQAGNAKDVCVEEAKSAYADEKCEALAGEAKASCIAAA